MVGEAGVKTVVAGDRFIMQGDNLSGEHVILGIVPALIDSNLQVKVRRFDDRKTIFAGVGKLTSLIAEEATNVGVEAIRCRFHIQMPNFTDKGLSCTVMAVWDMVALLIARELTDTAVYGADDAALLCILMICRLGVDGAQ